MSITVATSLPEALHALAATPDALVLAGGTDLLVEINEQHRQIDPATTVISIARIPELRQWTLDPAGRTLRIGAGVTYAEIAADPIAGLLPALAQAARTVGSPQIRNAATIGGNLGTCSPAGDGLPPLAALDAVVELSSAVGTRRMPVAEFMVGVKRTARQPGELITAVEVPLLDGWQGYAKVGVRNAMVIAISGACLAIDRPARSVRLALGSVGPTIIRAAAAEALVAAAIDWEHGVVAAGDADRFAAAAAEAASPISDHRATADYRRHSIAVLARRLLARAFTIADEVAA